MPHHQGASLRKRNVDVASLQARGHNVFRRRSSPHLPRHLLFCVLAYRLQAERRGDLMSRADVFSMVGPPEDTGKRGGSWASDIQTESISPDRCLLA